MTSHTILSPSPDHCDREKLEETLFALHELRTSDKGIHTWPPRSVKPSGTAATSIGHRQPHSISRHHRRAARRFFERLGAKVQPMCVRSKSASPSASQGNELGHESPLTWSYSWVNVDTVIALERSSAVQLFDSKHITGTDSVLELLIANSWRLSVRHS